LTVPRAKNGAVAPMLIYIAIFTLMKEVKQISKEDCIKLYNSGEWKDSRREVELRCGVVGSNKF